MTEVEILKKQIEALIELVAIKDQAIAALKNQPYQYYYQYPYHYQTPYNIVYTTQGTTGTITGSLGNNTTLQTSGYISANTTQSQANQMNAGQAGLTDCSFTAINNESRKAR